MSSLKEKVIRWLGGYATLEEAIDSVEGKDRIIILTRAVKRLFNTIGADDILRIHESGHWMFEGRPLSAGEKDMLIAEATQLLESKLWKVLEKDVTYQANRKMFLESKDELDLVAGKLWVYTFDVMRTRLNSMKSKRGTFNSTN